MESGRHRRRLRHQGLRHRRGCCSGRVEIDPDGRISIYCDHVEMGNGIGTALANRVAGHMGGVADEVSVARIDTFDALGLVTSGDPYTMDQADAGRRAAQSALGAGDQLGHQRSIGAHVGTHAAAEAARVMFRFGLWPAALDLWRIAPTDPRAKQWAKARWQDGQLHDAGPGAARAAGTDRGAALRATSVTGAMAHGFSRWAWSRATLCGCRASNGPPRSTRWRCGGGSEECVTLRAHQRQIPADLDYTAGRHRLHLAVRHRGPHRNRARDRRAAHRQGLQRVECGEALVPEVVLGQAQGGFAMGVGYALLESLPPFEGGPGNGQWNLGHYLIARGSDLPLHDLEIEMLPPLARTRRQRAWRRW